MAGDIDALIRKLDRMHSSIDDDVDEVLKTMLASSLEILL